MKEKLGKKLIENKIPKTFLSTCKFKKKLKI